MKHEFLGLIPIEEALQKQSEIHSYVSLNPSAKTILAFECESVITLGVRGAQDDLKIPSSILAEKGFKILSVDRGGQATIHNPGQLVIFPIVALKDLGTRAWVNFLLKVTRLTLHELGLETQCREGAPGLFSAKGKVASIGVRVRKGISTHGIAINVHNELCDFGLIRACGVEEARVDQLGGSYRLEEVFAVWMRIFEAELPLELTNVPILQNLESTDRALIAQLVRALP